MVGTQVWKGYTVASYKVVRRNSTVVCMQSFRIAFSLAENQTQHLRVQRYQFVN